MSNTINKLLKQQIEPISPDKDILDKINEISNNFTKDLKQKLKKKKIKADVFIGGSLAKDTIIKKEKYDIDVFVRFKGYKDKEISQLLGKILKNLKPKKIHGSRDYYQLKKQGIIIEIIPVLKINKPEQAKNITDLSYFHVSYVVNKIRKNKKLADEIKLAKTFSHSCNCYGAESYIQGFSGYALELLILHYKSFLNFIKTIANINNTKIVIDDRKFYKNSEKLLEEMNKSKTQSPIILIDPTFKERNASASLSEKTLNKFKEVSKKFLKNPNGKFFIKKDIKDGLKKKYKEKLQILSIKTNKQAGDIAGTKSRKFFDFFIFKLKREFIIKVAEFDYNEKENLGYLYFIVDKKKDEIIKGPHITKVENLKKFKKTHPKAFVKHHFAHTKISHNLSLNKWFNLFKKKEKKVIRDMCIRKMSMDKNL